MIEYIIDKDKTYSKTVKTILRSHNNSYTNSDLEENLNLYALQNGKLIGYMHSNFFWDWVNINTFVYENLNALKALTYKVMSLYKDKAVGIKCFTEDKKRYSDYLNAGYLLDGSVTLSEEKHYYYMSFFDFEDTYDSNIELLVSEEPLIQYDATIKPWIKTVQQAIGQDEEGIDFDLAVVMNQECIGGLNSTIYHNMIYVNKISVDKKYRNKHIGSTLMGMVIDHAKTLDLPFVMLSTTSFHARPFYEKLGFEVAYTRKNHPKGFDAYTMVKRLK
ncbi:MAG: GNAT family N-acetyltransferase [Candidatus Izemoplasmataceae bacterium]